VQTATKWAIGAGGIIIVGGLSYYEFGRMPNMSGYKKLLLGASQWGITECQVRDPAQYLTSSAVISTSTGVATATKLDSVCGTIYINLGQARDRWHRPLLYNGKGNQTFSTGTPLYAWATATRHSTSVNWTVAKSGAIHLATQSGVVGKTGTITGGATC